VEGLSGTNRVTWDASGLASGIYLAVITQTDENNGFVSRQVLKIAVIR
jgi:hypothetical protein